MAPFVQASASSSFFVKITALCGLISSHSNCHCEQSIEFAYCQNKNTTTGRGDQVLAHIKLHTGHIFDIFTADNCGNSYCRAIFWTGDNRVVWQDIFLRNRAALAHPRREQAISRHYLHNPASFIQETENNRYLLQTLLLNSVCLNNPGIAATN